MISAMHIVYIHVTCQLWFSFVPGWRTWLGVKINKLLLFHIMLIMFPSDRCPGCILVRSSVWSWVVAHMWHRFVGCLVEFPSSVIWQHTVSVPIEIQRIWQDWSKRSMHVCHLSPSYVHSMCIYVFILQRCSFHLCAK